MTTKQLRKAIDALIEARKLLAQSKCCDRTIEVLTSEIESLEDLFIEATIN